MSDTFLLYLLTRMDSIPFVCTVVLIMFYIGVIIGIIAFEVKEFLDDEILHKDFGVEKFIEENTVDWGDGYKREDLGKAKLWQLKRIIKYKADNIDKYKNET